MASEKTRELLHRIACEMVDRALADGDAQGYSDVTPEEWKKQSAVSHIAHGQNHCESAWGATGTWTSTAIHELSHGICRLTMAVALIEQEKLTLYFGCDCSDETLEAGWCEQRDPPGRWTRIVIAFGNAWFRLRPF